mgnify:CR=1 FL=1
MAKIFIPSPLRDLSSGIEAVELPARTLGQAIRALDERFPGMADRLIRDDRLAPGMAASIDGAIVGQGLLAKLLPDSEVHFLPAFGGG